MRSHFHHSTLCLLYLRGLESGRDGLRALPEVLDHLDGHPEVSFLALGDLDKLGRAHPGHGAVHHEERLQGNVDLALAEPLSQEQGALVL